MDIHIIIMSAYYPQSDNDDINLQGIFRCVNKPFEIEDVLNGGRGSISTQGTIQPYYRISSLFTVISICLLRLPI